ncbi:hypothetical protein [Bradyrhizobium japonicum]|uniref:hypothetical protein n=1 Tax=Bradyrhizobium japonicum TaxID=375 RepID=UPI002012C34A|nr:hypothetical protein [Bradyrhizobium japonicum]
MRSVMLLALSLMFVGAWSHDSARGQTSAAPPVSLAPPDASPPRPSAKNSKPRAELARVPTDRAPPNPAADYDGFSVGTVDDNGASSQVRPPVRLRTAKDARSNPDANDLDREDEALKRKLMICQNCK